MARNHPEVLLNSGQNKFEKLNIVLFDLKDIDFCSYSNCIQNSTVVQK